MDDDPLLCPSDRLRHIARAVFLKNALIKIPIPYHPNTLLQSLAFQTPDIMHILSRTWLAGIILLTITALILRKKVSREFFNRITVLNAIILWYNPLYW